MLMDGETFYDSFSVGTDEAVQAEAARINEEGARERVRNLARAQSGISDSDGNAIGLRNMQENERPNAGDANFTASLLQQLRSEK
mmetsp:Transcript_19450/g.26986  ORF Transcript_19450/g.26986 Transcript_19450/m.26986 type:complete len:85 (+) Transcript_19450:387-641(+)